MWLSMLSPVKGEMIRYSLRTDMVEARDNDLEYELWDNLGDK